MMTRVLIGLLVGCFVSLSGVGTAKGGESPPVRGDADCNGIVSLEDAMRALTWNVRDVSAESARCWSSETEWAGVADLNCDTHTDARDVIVLMSYLAGILRDPGPECSRPGDSVGAPLVDDFSCELDHADLNSAIRCRYSVFQSSVEPTVFIAESGGGSSVAVAQARSVGCDPGELNCRYAASAELDVTFSQSGSQTLTMTACAEDRCASRVISILVTG